MTARRSSIYSVSAVLLFFSTFWVSAEQPRPAVDEASLCKHCPQASDDSGRAGDGAEVVDSKEKGSAQKKTVLPPKARKKPGVRLAALRALAAAEEDAQPVLRAKDAAGQGAAYDGSKGQRALILSLDGAMPGTVQSMIQKGQLPNLARLAGRGVGPLPAQPPTPSLTPVSHASILTGAWPDKTGVLSTWFHDVKQVLSQTSAGFAVPIPVDTLLQAARRQGKKTAGVGWPNVLSGDADWVVRLGESRAYSTSVSKKQADWADASAAGWKLGQEPINPGTSPKSAEFSMKAGGKDQKIYFLAHGKAGSYEEVYLDQDQDLGNGYLGKVRVGEWVNIPFSADKSEGSRGRLMSMSPDLGEFRFYAGGVYSTEVFPESLKKEIVAKFGFYPGDPDYYKLQDHVVDEKTVLEQNGTVDGWLASAARYVWEEKRPDLLMAYQLGIDVAEHQFSLTEPRQLGYSAQRAAQYGAYVSDTYKDMDKRIGPLLDGAQDANTFIVSDHGMAPLHSNFYVSEMLKNSGFQMGTQVRAVGGGGALHLYINKQGREQGGSVSDADYAALQGQLAQQLSGYRDPRTGEPVFDIVRKKGDLASLHLEHPNAGDVVAIAHPGYYVDGKEGKSPMDVMKLTSYYGQHGYDSTLPEMQALFMAAGPRIRSAQDVKPGETIPGSLRLIDVAPTAAKAMDIDAPQDADGQAVDIVRDPAQP